MKKLPHNKGFVWGSGTALLFFCLALFILPFILERGYTSEGGAEPADLVAEASAEPSFKVVHLDTPEPMKAIYMTACVAATPSWRTELRRFVEESELNAILIDIKDYSGTVSIIDPELQANDAPGCKVGDMREFVDELHKSGIYVIGRITVFQDPYYASRHPEFAVQSKSGGVWKDRKGLSFIDVGAKEYWEYIVELSKKSYALGFDELNFDYVRYPSDGDMDDADYTWTVGPTIVAGTTTPLLTRAEMLKSFFIYLHDELEDLDVKTSADLFGLTTLTTSDMGIGQVLENTLPYFDYVYPMVYPSHFAYNTGGFGDPATHPYEIIKYSMTEGVKREMAQRVSMGISTSTPSKLKPWLQDFDLGADYGPAEIRAQIQGTYDSGLTGWLIWDASNRYTRDAYLPTGQAGLTE